ncbi:MAG: serine hydrolase, partial [Nitriliruptor sp.]
MSRGRKILLSVVVLLAVVLAGAAVYLQPIAPIATGYAAKTVCSAHFVSGRTVEDAEGDLPANPLVPLMRTTADDATGTARTSLLGLWSSTAHFTEGLGCTLAEERPDFATPPTVEPGEAGASWPEGVGAAQVSAGVDVDALDAAIDTAFTEDDPEGRLRNTRAVVVVRDGELIAERYGEGFTADTPLLGWSMGKSIANGIVGRLVGDGDMALDADGLRPEWADDNRATITLEHLLTMTSGLSFEEVYDPDTDATRMLFTPRDTARYAADKELVSAPGTRWSYSSGTTNILCDLAQEASGLDVELAHELVFAPLGMASAVIEPDA